MSITPECYSGILVKNTPSFRKGLGVSYICRFLRFSFSFTSLIPCLLPPRDEREKTERTTAQIPANKKCCLLIFAIAIGCLVLAAIPASPLQFPSVPFRSLWYIRYCRSPSSWLSCSAGSPKRSWRLGVQFAVPPARNPLSSTKNHPNYRFLFVFMQKLLYLCRLK